MQPLRPQWWERYIGAPVVLPGDSLITGIDCWQLYVRVQRDDFGRHVDDFGRLYAEGGGTVDEIRARARAAIAGELPGWRQVPWEEGAGVLFGKRGINAHIGIATARRNVLLHAGEGGVNLLDLSQSPKWKARLVGCFVPAD